MVKNFHHGFMKVNNDQEVVEFRISYSFKKTANSSNKQFNITRICFKRTSIWP